jgi:hypothetical protein
MLDEQLLELISTTSEILDLEDAVVEKDYYVTKVIHSLSDTESDYFRLIFAGGTCLAKAHKIIKRMSEDIDFKIQIKKTDLNFSKTRLLKELKEFRAQIKSKLILAGFLPGDPIVRNKGQYSRIELNYPSVFAENTSLRPHILLEFTVADIRLSVASIPIITLVEDTLENVVILPNSAITCISAAETAVEKWVGLTRRIIAIERTYHYDDKTLIRHVYDLNAITQFNGIESNFCALAKIIIQHDSKQFKNQHPEYATDPSSEIKQSLVLLKSKPIWKERYQEFIEAMVYDSLPAPKYENAINILEHISTEIMNSMPILLTSV